MVEDATLVALNAVLAAALLQAHQKNKSTFGPSMLSP